MSHRKMYNACHTHFKNHPLFSNNAKTVREKRMKIYCPIFNSHSDLCTINNVIVTSKIHMKKKLVFKALQVMNELKYEI